MWTRWPRVCAKVSVMNSCFDCKHHCFHDSPYSSCLHGCYKYPDIIGRYSQDCYDVRGDEDQCGKEGKGFEPIPPKPPHVNWFDRLTLAFARFRNGY